MTIVSMLGLIVFAGMVVFAFRHLHKSGGTSVNDFRYRSFQGRRSEIEIKSDGE